MQQRPRTQEHYRRFNSLTQGERLQTSVIQRIIEPTEYRIASETEDETQSSQATPSFDFKLTIRYQALKKLALLERLRSLSTNSVDWNFLCNREFRHDRYFKRDKGGMEISPPSDRNPCQLGNDSLSSAQWRFCRFPPALHSISPPASPAY